MTARERAVEALQAAKEITSATGADHVTRQINGALAALIADTVRPDRERLAQRLAEIADIEQSEIKRQIMRDAVAALRLPVPDEGWRAIESAPKTSRAILVHCPERQNTYAVCWLRDHWEFFGGAGRELTETPTHWRPLPAPPMEDKP